MPHEFWGIDVTITFMESLAQPFALSQRPLLTEDQFLREAKRRGLWLASEQDLELLHRLDLLVPVLRYDRPVRSLRAGARRTPELKWEILAGIPPVTAPELLAEASFGRVVVARDTPFKSWRRRRRVHGDVGYLAWDHLYSPYQLLAIPRVDEALRARRSRFVSREWRESTVRAVRTASQRNDRLVAILTAVEPVYYPGIAAHARMPHAYGDGFSAYDVYVEGIEAGRLLQTIETTPGELVELAKSLLLQSHSIDPLKNWSELIALIHPDRWARLEGSALMAIDLRIAAEILLRLYDELAAAGKADPLPALPHRMWDPLHDRVRGRREELDEILINYNLSPHPALMLIVEGWIEAQIVPRVMRMLSIPVRDSFIQVHDLGGATKSVEQIARLSAPRLRRTSPTAADMLRPPMRVLVVMDEEGDYSTPAKRTMQEHAWAEYAWNMLDADLQGDEARDELRRMIDVTTWRQGSGSLEMAHFTTHQLALAHAKSGQIPAGRDLAWVEREITTARSTGRSLRRMWNTWPQPRPTKKALWEELWPVLERRVRREIDRGSPDSIPICDVLMRARRSAAGHRRHVVMRVG